ncbi:MAG TPA: hypothetical protein VK815_12780 [Candidatus Acidoferrales bacterium]|jgi:hypothetical protein|nr:hypothetical protein [Candidatus Acidoferrales bacterium]
MKKLICLSGLIMAASDPLSPVFAQNGYLVHEWGTFTSVQGGDGELLPWRPLQTAELPGFVYNWNRPGLNREPMTAVRIGKGGMVTLQRMETPVIYFYSHQDMKVDVGVDFPKGFITEWYPQATQIGPSLPVNTNVACDSTLGESRAVWKDLRLVAPAINSADIYVLPQDKSGSHYFAARETGSDIVQVDFAGPTNRVSEVDKFIFYRGAGSFKTPLRVSMDAGGAVTANNSGTGDLAHLFLISVHDAGHGKTAAFATLPRLAAGDSVSCPRLQPADFVPLEKFQSEIFPQVQAALMDAGLFKAEAAAMVNTWKDSWFAEEGDRVLYILPRAWTDETLPMTLNPKPLKLVRVMVGRAEIITPRTALELSGNLTRAAAGDAGGRTAAVHEIKALGRFAEPALRLAYVHDQSTNAFELGYRLLYESAQETAPSKFE